MEKEFKPVTEIKIGDYLCEADGFLWEVLEINDIGKKIEFTVQNKWSMFSGKRKEKINKNRLVSYMSKLEQVV